MVWPIVIAAVAAVAGIASSLDSGKKAKKQAREVGRENARLIREETAEAIRRASAEGAQTVGQTTALLGGTGVRASGTATDYLGFMRSEQTRQLDWLERSGESRALAARRGATYLGDTAMNQAYTSAITQFGGWVSSAAQSGAFSGGGTT